MFDLELAFFTEQDLSAAITSDSIDLRQDWPNLGRLSKTPLAAVVTGIDASASDGGSMTVTIQASEDDETFADVAVYTFSGDDLASPLVAPFPMAHARYVRIVTAPTGITGKSTTSGFGFISNEYPLDRRVPFDGFEIKATID